MIERATDRRHAVSRGEKIKLSEPGFRERIALTTRGVSITNYAERTETNGPPQRLSLVGLSPPPQRAELVRQAPLSLAVLLLRL
jgi:hypothetical protein